MSSEIGVSSGIPLVVPPRPDLITSLELRRMKIAGVAIAAALAAFVCGLVALANGDQGPPTDGSVAFNAVGTIALLVGTALGIAAIAVGRIGLAKTKLVSHAARESRSLARIAIWTATGAGICFWGLLFAVSAGEGL